MLTKIIMVLLMVTMVRTDSNKFSIDKQAHFIGSYGLYFMFRYKEFSEIDSFKYTFYCGLGKELIDYYTPKYEYGKSTSGKFSKYDLYYNLLGISTAFGIDKLWIPKRVNIKYSKNQLHFDWKFK